LAYAHRRNFVPNSYRFGRFELRPDERALLSSGQPLRVGARAFDILLALIERRDRLVEFDELLDVVWPGLAVEENNLSVQVSTLRKVLGNDVITTVCGRGYRFTVAAEPIQSSSTSTNAIDVKQLALSTSSEDAAAEARMSQAMLPSVAIVPFASPQAGDSTIGIGDVLADQLISVLSSSSALNVISRLSTTASRDRTTPLPRIASLLSAHFVCSTGAMRRSCLLTRTLRHCVIPARQLWTPHSSLHRGASRGPSSSTPRVAHGSLGSTRHHRTPSP